MPYGRLYGLDAAVGVEVSVIIPVLNGARFLPESLASIPRLPGLEVIVVDDGSTDASAQIAAAAGARCLKGEGRGPAAARNLGITASTGRFLAFLDADDSWPAGSLEARQQILKAGGCQVVQGLIQTVAEENVSAALLRRKHTRPTFNVNLGASLFERGCVLEAEGFDASLRFAEDFDFFVRLWETQVQKAFLPEVCLTYRLHGENMCADAPQDAHVMFLMLKRHKERMKKKPVELQEKLVTYLGWDQASLAGEAPPSSTG